jgi:glutamyl/glutaminyl-tRNA synthetase
LELAVSKFSEERKSSESAGSALQASIKFAGQELGVKGKNLYFPFRVALTAQGSGPEMQPLAQLLGFDEVEKRLQLAIQFVS